MDGPYLAVLSTHYQFGLSDKYRKNLAQAWRVLKSPSPNSPLSTINKFIHNELQSMIMNIELVIISFLLLCAVEYLIHITILKNFTACVSETLFGILNPFLSISFAKNLHFSCFSILIFAVLRCVM